MLDGGHLDKIGLHRVSNPCATAPSVSLHLYSPPIEICQTFCPKTGTARKSGKCVFYSVHGKKLTTCAAAGSTGPTGPGLDARVATLEATGLVMTNTGADGPLSH
jgi:hypothetical protein